MENDRDGKFPLPIFIIFLLFSAFADLLSIIPLVGTIFIVTERGALWLMGVNTKIANSFMFGGAIGEAIPVVSALPLCMGYTVAVYISDKIEARIEEKLGAGAGNVTSKMTTNPINKS